MTTRAQPTVSQEEYERIALADFPEVKWELHEGTLREKPPMTTLHNDEYRNLRDLLVRQLDRQQYVVCTDDARLRLPSGDEYVPDLCVVPRQVVRRNKIERPTRLEVYGEPVPLVVEVWSPSTGRYDVDTKFPDYMLRGDLELWRVHPIERTVITWVQQPDGGYVETVYTSGVIHLGALTGVSIDLADLFAE